MFASAVVIVLSIAGSACGSGRAEPVELARDGVAVREPALVREAAALVAKLECNRCHELPDIAAAAPEKQCFGCHQRIHAGTFTPKHIPVSVWQDRITSLRYAPSLAAADRLRRVWVQQYLLHPHDLRPG